MRPGRKKFRGARVYREAAIRRVTLAQRNEAAFGSTGRADVTETPAIRMQISVSASQAKMIEEFQKKESLPTRTMAIELLLDIALETVTSSGRRFWDKSLVKPEE
jgi:hypothetical protein